MIKPPGHGRYFILDGKKTVPVETMEDYVKWRAAMSDDVTRVAFTDLNKDVSVSTVFLGVNHNFFNGPPLLFETMVFGGQFDEGIRRYSTWDEAEAGHHETVFAVKRHLLRIVGGTEYNGNDIDEA